MTWYQASDTLLSPVYFSIPTVLWERNILLQTADIWGAEGIAFLMGFTQGLVVRIIVHIEEKDFTYNPGTKTLNVINLNSKSANIGNLNITTSTADNKRIVDFSFI